MSEQNKQVELYKAVRTLAENTDESIVNVSALCRLLDVDHNRVRQYAHYHNVSAIAAIQYVMNNSVK
ncbi:hypothetical protein AT542_001202 [Escherichia coli]|nr:hypothetical protein [Escherichia coli]